MTNTAQENGGMRLSYPTLVASLCVAVIVTGLASLTIGDADIGIGQLWQSLFKTDLTQSELIMREIRLPRTLLALLVGGALGVSGAAMQGLLRNPLAEPGIIGVSGTAGLGAVIALYSGLSAGFGFALPLMAIGGALFAVTLLQFIAVRQSTLTLILGGVAISSLAGALTSLALNLSPNPYAAYEAVIWILGSLTDRSMSHVFLAAPFILLGCLMMLSVRKDLDALSLGEDTARSLGVDLVRTRRLIIFGTALCVGGAVAVSGVIGFVGLIIPHLMRPLVAHKPSRLLLVSGLGGGLLLLLADMLVRILPTGAELKIGVVTALIGAPFFFHLVMRSRR